MATHNSSFSPDRFFSYEKLCKSSIIILNGIIVDKIQDSKLFGSLIRKKRKDQRLTQEELAALAGVGVRFVRELERGKENCRIGLAFKVMQTLGLSLAVYERERRPS